MITVRFRDTFRERMPEWITSAAMVLWGLIVINEPNDLWSREFYTVLETIASQETWGWVTLIIGATRLIALYINGAWRPTGHIRTFGAFVGSVVWAGLIAGYVMMEWTPPGLATQTAMLVLDFAALWFAAGDAKMADIRAKKKKHEVLPV